LLLGPTPAMQFYPKVDFKPVPTAFKVQRQF
ncbi:GCN5 family acetyltransferase, partial [Lacticaseibacillus rhamnosus]